MKSEITKIKFDCWSIYRLSTNFLYDFETWFNEQYKLSRMGNISNGILELFTCFIG